jgi:transcription elongation factor GreA
LSKLSSIDMAQIPLDRVGLGSRVVVEDQKTREREVYHLVFGDAVEFEDGHVTMSSPIGRALLGKGVGDKFVLRLPAATRQLKLVELQTIHDDVAAP